VPSRESKAKFIEPMLLLAVETLPGGADRVYGVKLDGYRALAVTTNRKTRLAVAEYGLQCKVSVDRIVGYFQLFHWSMADLVALWESEGLIEGGAT
jgi:hypothetical protein